MFLTSQVENWCWEFGNCIRESCTALWPTWLLASLDGVGLVGLAGVEGKKNREKEPRQKVFANWLPSFSHFQFSSVFTFISGVWAYDLETIRRQSWTGRAGVSTSGPRSCWQTLGFSGRFFFLVGFLMKRKKPPGKREEAPDRASALWQQEEVWHLHFAIGSSSHSHTATAQVFGTEMKRGPETHCEQQKESTLLWWNRVAGGNSKDGNGLWAWQSLRSGPKKENQLLPKPSENAYKVKEADLELYKSPSCWAVVIF